MTIEIVLMLGIFVCAILHIKIMCMQAVYVDQLWIIPFSGFAQFLYGLFGLFVQSKMQFWILFKNCPPIVFWITTIALTITALFGIGQATTVQFYMQQENEDDNE